MVLNKDARGMFFRHHLRGLIFESNSRCLSPRWTTPLEGYSWGIFAGLPHGSQKKQHIQKNSFWIQNVLEWFMYMYIYIVLYRILWKVFFEWWVLLQLSSGDLADVFSILVWCSMGQKWGTWNSFTYFKCIWHEFASNGAIKQWASRHKADGDNNTNNNHRHGTPIPMVEMIWSNDAICAGFAAGFTNGIYMGH